MESQIKTDLLLRTHTSNNFKCLFMFSLQCCVRLNAVDDFFDLQHLSTLANTILNQANVYENIDQPHLVRLK